MFFSTFIGLQRKYNAQCWRTRDAFGIGYRMRGSLANCLYRLGGFQCHRLYLVGKSKFGGCLFRFRHDGYDNLGFHL